MSFPRNRLRRTRDCARTVGATLTSFVLARTLGATLTSFMLARTVGAMLMSFMLATACGETARAPVDPVTGAVNRSAPPATSASAVNAAPPPLEIAAGACELGPGAPRAAQLMLEDGTAFATLVGGATSAWLSPTGEAWVRTTTKDVRIVGRIAKRGSLEAPVYVSTRLDFRSVISNGKYVPFQLLEVKNDSVHVEMAPFEGLPRLDAWVPCRALSLSATSPPTMVDDIDVGDAAMRSLAAGSTRIAPDAKGEPTLTLDFPKPVAVLALDGGKSSGTSGEPRVRVMHQVRGGPVIVGWVPKSRILNKVLAPFAPDPIPPGMTPVRPPHDDRSSARWTCSKPRSLVAGHDASARTVGELAGDAVFLLGEGSGTAARSVSVERVFESNGALTTTLDESCRPVAP